jgi:single-strand DNA-binding protein
MSYQKVIIVGRLGRAPELRYTPTGQAVCTLNVATDRTYTKDGQTVKQPTWFRVSAWGNNAENANKYLTKGRQVYIEGTLNADENGNPRTYKRQDGSTGASYEINAEKIVYLDGNKDAGNRTTDAPAEYGGDFDDNDFADF